MSSDTFDDLRDLYQEVILDHGRRPRHARRLEDFDATAKGDNPMCGDRIEVWVKYAPDGTIADTGFDARGCAISVASSIDETAWVAPNSMEIDRFWTAFIPIPPVPMTITMSPGRTLAGWTAESGGRHF